MSDLEILFRQNREWADRLKATRADFFESLAGAQSPQYLWIGCADSRVPANEIVGLLPGEIFVHRNIANVVVHTDLNCLSVMQFAVDVLQVRHIFVVGHYGCAGVGAALMMANLEASLRGQASMGQDLAELMKRVNSLVKDISNHSGQTVS